MSLPFDATMKEIIAPHPEDFASVFQFPKTTPARTLNVDLSTISAATDVAFGFGAPLQEIVDLNFQSGFDRVVPARQHLYNAAFHLRYLVPVRSVLILLRPKADRDDLTGNLTYVCGGKRVEFEYDVVRMWRQQVDLFLYGGLRLLPLATLCRMPEDKPLSEALREVVREIDRRLAEEADHAHAVRLMTAAFILTGLRVPKETLADIYDGVRIMHESTAYDVILEEGRAEGRLEGRLEGEIRNSHRLLLRQGQKRFGPPDPATESALKSVQDVERLERMAEALLSVSSWQELLLTR
jgi:predicted transposase YdaD